MSRWPWLLPAPRGAWGVAGRRGGVALHRGGFPEAGTHQGLTVPLTLTVATGSVISVQGLAWEKKGHIVGASSTLQKGGDVGGLPGRAVWAPGAGAQTAAHRHRAPRRLGPAGLPPSPAGWLTGQRLCRSVVVHAAVRGAWGEWAPGGQRQRPVHHTEPTVPPGAGHTGHSVGGLLHRIELNKESLCHSLYYFLVGNNSLDSKAKCSRRFCRESFRPWPILLCPALCRTRSVYCFLCPAA